MGVANDLSLTGQRHLWLFLRSLRKARLTEGQIEQIAPLATSLARVHGDILMFLMEVGVITEEELREALPENVPSYDNLNALFSKGDT